MSSASSEDFGPWSPGIKSQVPSEFLHLSTLYRPENVTTSIEEAHERAELTGLDAEELVAYRPSRLALHEVLIRVTGDLYVPDGKRYEDLGINFREIAARILDGYVRPEMERLERAHAEVCERAESLAREEFESATAPPKRDGDESGPGLLGRLAGKKKQPKKRIESEADRQRRILEGWKARAQSEEDDLKKAVLESLHEIVGAAAVQAGRIPSDASMLVPIVKDRVANSHGSKVIGELIEPLFARAVEEEGYRVLPARERPVVMNIKGASAAGKSTMRPMQKILAERLGVDWTDFAVISPDIWRKFLLDYDSLGEASRYAASLTGKEFWQVDQKLDRYMAEKARARQISHLLIDRFRFDSFTLEREDHEQSRLLTRFGDTVYLFFMVTPPEATVERAFERGCKVGRFKAVDDLLHHNVEAYTGMPRLFFKWASRKDMDVHCEFLDNSVAKGHRPKTIAFCVERVLNILDIKRMIDIDRFTKIDIEARSVDEVYPDGEAMAAERNTQFLKQCTARLPLINLAEQETGRIYARVRERRFEVVDKELLARMAEDPEIRTGLLALGMPKDPADLEVGSEEDQLDPAVIHSLGQWGGRDQGRLQDVPDDPEMASA